MSVSGGQGVQHRQGTAQEQESVSRQKKLVGTGGPCAVLPELVSCLSFLSGNIIRETCG